MQNGFEDVFTSTAMAALEAGAMDYAKGLIDNQYSHYIRADGLTNYRANEVAQQARMLTILALYHSYSGDDATLLKYFAKAKALADWLKARRETSLRAFAKDDPRYGLIAGLDEGDSFVHVYFHQGPYQTQHWYSHIAEAYRAFVEIGQVWAKVGKAAGRADVAAHGADLVSLAPDLYHDLHASLNKTMNTTSSPGHTCYPDNAGVFGSHKSYGGGCSFRAYPEMFYSGALTAEQTDAMYTSGQGQTTCMVGRWLTDGSPSSGDGLIFTHIPQGLPFGLLVYVRRRRLPRALSRAAAAAAAWGHGHAAPLPLLVIPPHPCPFLSVVTAFPASAWWPVSLSVCGARVVHTVCTCGYGNRPY